MKERKNSLSGQPTTAEAKVNEILYSEMPIATKMRSLRSVAFYSDNSSASKEDDYIHGDIETIVIRPSVKQFLTRVNWAAVDIQARRYWEVAAREWATLQYMRMVESNSGIIGKVNVNYEGYPSVDASNNSTSFELQHPQIHR